MKNKILAGILSLFLIVSGIILISGGKTPSREESVFSSISLEGVNHLEYDDAPEESVVIAEDDVSLGSFTQGIYDFLSWTGSNIQEFLGWAGGNIWDFLAWAGSNTYEATAALGKGGTILLLVLLLLMISYGAIAI
ncbi:MAG: hypothetical protein V5A66_00070 [Candidatus Thermoplasmatota archaeon]